MRMHAFTPSIFAIVVMFCCVAFAQGHTPEDSESARLRVVVTTTMLEDAIRTIAGDKVEITALVAPGVDPHTYMPTQSDIDALHKADIVFCNGLHLELHLGPVLKALSERGVVVYTASEPVEQAGYVLTEQVFGDVWIDDPHLWNDPLNWQLVVSGVADVLARVDPENSDFYLRSAQLYTVKLEALHEWAEKSLAQIPARQRVLVTSHDAFQYFALAYGWEVRGLQGVSTEDEIGVADVQSLANFIVDRQIPVIFVESSSSSAAVSAVRESVRSQGIDLRFGLHDLYADSTGTQGTLAATYTGMVASNVITIVESFGYAALELPAALSLPLETHS